MAVEKEVAMNESSGRRGWWETALADPDVGGELPEARKSEGTGLKDQDMLHFLRRDHQHGAHAQTGQMKEHTGDSG